MSDMQWRRRDGSTGTYNGPLFHLGSGIPRRMGDYGPRRALFDLAFGYVSGFPVRDVLAFAMRSLFPAKPLSISAEPTESDGTIQVGTVHIACPECGAIFPVVVTARIEDSDRAFEGGASLVCEPQMTDAWAHMWTHQAEDEAGD